MAVTGSATPLKRYRSALTAFSLCNAAAGTETLTLIHRLSSVLNAPVTPHEIRFTLRSVVTGNASGYVPTLQLQAYTASNATVLQGGAGAPAFNGIWDITAEFCHSDNR